MPDREVRSIKVGQRRGLSLSRRVSSSASGAWVTCAGTASRRSSGRSAAIDAGQKDIVPGTARREHLSVRCARIWDCRHHIAWGRRHANHRPVRRGPRKWQGLFQAIAGTRQRGRKRRRRVLAPGRPEERKEKSDAPTARGTAGRRLRRKRSLSRRKRKEGRRTAAPAVQS